MVRAVNAKKLLEAIQKPEGLDLTIRVRDDLIKENNAVFRVREDAVEIVPKETNADAELPTGVLGQLAVGGISPDEAVLMKDVKVFANMESFRRFFYRKNIYVSEHF